MRHRILARAAGLAAKPIAHVNGVIERSPSYAADKAIASIEGAERR